VWPPKESFEDYITVTPARNDRFLVSLMRYHKADDNYEGAQWQGPYKRELADNIAKAWAETLKLEVR